MSDTTEKPAEEPVEAPAPEPTPTPPPEPAEPPEDPASRRFTRMSARLGLLARERDDLAARVAQLEQARAAPTTHDQQYQAAIQQEAARLQQAQDMNRQAAEFHAAGEAAMGADWHPMCQRVVAMGADPHFAELLIGLKDGPRVVAALEGEPDELERITGLRGDARALALGRFVERLDRQPAKPRSKAPPPITPLVGKAAPRFDIYTANAQELAQYFAKEDMEKRLQAQRKGG